MLMYDVAITAQANGSRTVHQIAAIVGTSIRVVRRTCRRLNLPLPA